MKNEQLMAALQKFGESIPDRVLAIATSLTKFFQTTQKHISRYRGQITTFLALLVSWLNRLLFNPLKKRCAPLTARVEKLVIQLDERYGLFGHLNHQAMAEHEQLTPENIHHALRIIYPKSWISQCILGIILIWAIGYMIFGKIPITGKGNAMFITRNTVIPFQSTASGRIAQVHKKVGDSIKKGEVLFVLDQPLIDKELKQTRQQLQDMQEKHAVSKSLLETYTQLEKEGIQRKQKSLDERYAVLEKEVERSKLLAEEMRTRRDQYQSRNLQDIFALRDLENKRANELQQKFQHIEDLRKQNLRSEDALLDARQAISDQAIRIADMDAQVVELKGQNVSSIGSYLDTLQQIVEKQDAAMDLAQERSELANRLAQIEEQYASANFAMEKEASELERQITLQEKQLKQNREIISDFDGRILELTVSEGKLISKGQRLGSIDARLPTSVLEAVAYFSLADGKKIRTGMKLRLLPAQVQQERFGRLLAKVTSVSNFPVTAEGVATIVGNSKIASELTKDGHQIEVFAELLTDNDTYSGYQWDQSDGPDLKIESGTLASALVNIKERAPFTFVIPVTKE